MHPSWRRVAGAAAGLVLGLAAAFYAGRMTRETALAAESAAGDVGQLASLVKRVAALEAGTGAEGGGTIAGRELVLTGEGDRRVVLDADGVLYARKIVLTDGAGDEERMATFSAGGMLLESLGPEGSAPTKLMAGSLQLGGMQNDCQIVLDANWRGGAALVLYCDARVGSEYGISPEGRTNLEIRDADGFPVGRLALGEDGRAQIQFNDPETGEQRIAK